MVAKGFKKMLQTLQRTLERIHFKKESMDIKSKSSSKFYINLGTYRGCVVKHISQDYPVSKMRLEHEVQSQMERNTIVVSMWKTATIVKAKVKNKKSKTSRRP